MTLEEAFADAVRRHKDGQLDEAAAIYQRILAQAPDLYEGYRHLGLLRTTQERAEEAAEEFRRACALRDESADAHNNLGQAYFSMGRFGEAIAQFGRAVELDEEVAGYRLNLGNAYQKTAQFAEAMECYQKALALEPELAAAHWNLGILLLLQGDYRRGWAEYEWRWKVAELDHPRMTFTQPIWNGGPLEGRRILLHAEQGLGDAIQFLRYAPRVARRGGRVIVACQRALAPLARGMQGVESVAPLDEALAEFDVHCPLMSLHRAFFITPRNIPGEAYLKAEAARAAKFRDRIPRDGKLNVGLVWANKPRPADRAPAADDLAPLARIGGARYFSLQKWRSDMARTAPPLTMVDWTEELDDLADTAGLIECLDLVITVDTAVAHLAGAMGKAAWVLLKHVPDWRWMLERADSPWYPSLRLFRQPRPGDWTTPISQIAASLRAQT